MRHSTGRPTKAEAARMAKLKRMQCIACHTGTARLMNISGSEVHHLLSGNRRRGHMFTIPLCAWHHRGHIGPLWTKRYAREMLGPSLADGSKPFHATFGTDNELLKATNDLLERL